MVYPHIATSADEIGVPGDRAPGLHRRLLVDVHKQIRLRRHGNVEDSEICTAVACTREHHLEVVEYPASTYPASTNVRGLRVGERVC